MGAHLAGQLERVCEAAERVWLPEGTPGEGAAATTAQENLFDAFREARESLSRSRSRSAQRQHAEEEEEEPGR